MAEGINYYEILLNIENQLYKISSYTPEAEKIYTASLLNLIRLEVVNYIYSIPILKKEFLTKTNHFANATHEKEFKEATNRVKKAIIEFYRINAHDEDDFLIENTPEIFYYPIVGENQNYHFEPMGIAYMYEYYNETFYRSLRTRYFHSLGIEYYILTLNAFARFHLDSCFGQSYMAAAIGRVLIDLYYLIDKKIRNTDSKMEESFTAALAGKNILSPRELEIAKLASQHKTRKEIAAELNISESTVQTHFKNIGAKTKINGLKNLRKYPPFNLS